MTSKTARISSALGIGSLQSRQLDTLQSLVTKHLTDPALTELASSTDFTVTSMERGVLRYEHPHLVAALDTLLVYQRDRRSRAGTTLMKHHGPRMKSSFTHDPRTRFIELLKRWLRTHAANADLDEDEVRRVSALNRDVLNHPRLFPSRNPRSFMNTLAEVYGHIQLQLREVLERDRTCAELAARVLSLSRNLVSDAIAYLLTAATDLKQTDRLPSLEVVALWQSLPPGRSPLPDRADPALQKFMEAGWRTHCGALVAAILQMPWAVRLFDSAGAQHEAAAAAASAELARVGGVAALTETAAQAAVPAVEDEPRGRARARGSSRGRFRLRSRSASTTSADRAESPDPPRSFQSFEPAEEVPALLAQVADEFGREQFKASGLAAVFREPTQEAARASYLASVEAVFDLIYLLGEVLVHFHRISDGLGDYGMIRVAPWLHPFLDAVVDKVQGLKGSLEALNKAVDSELVLAKARGRKVKQPAPTDRMSSRAHGSIERALAGRECHLQLLLEALKELRARSAPERLPHVLESLGDACTQLQNVLASSYFRARVGGAFPELPPLAAITMGQDGSILGAADEGAQPEGEFSDGEWDDPDLPRDSWICHRTPNQVQWWNTKLGPAPWDQTDACVLPQPLPAPAVDAGTPDQSPTSMAESVGDFQAEVYRLSNGKRHDRRCLKLTGSVLQIYEKGSNGVVKTEVDIVDGIADCSLLDGGEVLIHIRRPRRIQIPFLGSDEKEYRFEFEPASLARTFSNEVTRLRNRKTGRTW